VLRDLTFPHLAQTQHNYAEFEPSAAREEGRRDYEERERVAACAEKVHGGWHWKGS